MGLKKLFNKGRKTEKNEDLQPLKGDMVIFQQLEDSLDKTLTTLADEMKKGAPLVLNFGKLSIDDSNKAIAFLSGVTYALNGHIVQFGGDEGRSILFGDEKLYDDGTIQLIIDEIESGM